MGFIFLSTQNNNKSKNAKPKTNLDNKPETKPDNDIDDDTKIGIDDGNNTNYNKN
jgi:hypothetical protein